MLYNKAQLEKDLDRIERLDQMVSALVAEGAINGFMARDHYLEHEKMRRQAKMRLVNSQQVIGAFRGLEKIRQRGIVPALHVIEGDKTYHGEAAYERMERSAKLSAYWAKIGDADNTGVVEEEEVVPVVFTRLRRNPLGFIDQLLDGRWIPTHPDLVKEMTHVQW